MAVGLSPVEVAYFDSNLGMKIYSREEGIKNMTISRDFEHGLMNYHHKRLAVIKIRY
ncbi:hypothetical protein EC912_10788 [Luteibacter rhizovicinus]|uniref:Uncharacterized protein n=1 Tax=Luteibacter rhizovicinus TaxID=242606 RepID=A0A4R3YJP2_9GAMM|nr:hypothetical protein EC912_10788 [Luteibacter rhizovicinus]